MGICGWVVASGSDDSKFGIRKGASGSGGSKFGIGEWWQQLWHPEGCIGKKMGWGLGLFFVVFIFNCVIFILLCLNF